MYLWEIEEPFKTQLPRANPRTRYYDIDTGKNTSTYSRFKLPTSLGHSCQEPSVPCPDDALLHRGYESNWSFTCSATQRLEKNNEKLS
jgi:hypothetical protein